MLQAAHSLSLLCFRTARRSTSEKGQSRHFGRAPLTSGLPRTTDIVRPTRHVGKVPGTDIQARFEGAPNPGIYNGTVMPGMGH